MLCEAPTVTQEAISALKIASTDRERIVAQEAKIALSKHLSSVTSQEAPPVRPSSVTSQEAPPVRQSPVLPEEASTIQLSPPPSQEVKENIQKWEHRWEFVFLEEGEYVLYTYNGKTTGRAVWDFLASLGKDGWELVSVAPQIGDTNPQRGKSSNVMASLFDFAIAGPRVTTMSQHMTGTTGYFFWYKRPM
jgi:hypothetical protein